jgi:hypothetical protein
MGISFRDAGVIDAVDTDSITVHDPRSKVRFQVKRELETRFWLVQPGIRRNCRCTQEPVIGEVVSFMTAPDMITSWGRRKKARKTIINNSVGK